ncbi:MAG: hypothetical protein CSA65_07260 [Proteobacteria bacterium]|nr:MAG: hypothetical protein CSB49_02190 [Pseudomonadota bacterium]PIE17813.1 MAG: hypothetical protein CSA65_07260 [Pseudomonadota bacterium]
MMLRTSTTPLLLLLVLLCGGCGKELRVNLVLGECDQALLDWNTVLAIRAQLMRDRDGLTVQSACIKTSGILDSLADLGSLLGRSVVFNDLPAEGGWTVRVQGFFTEACLSKTTLVCGRLAGVDLGAGDSILLPVDCAPRVSADPPQKFKECVDEL